VPGRDQQRSLFRGQWTRWEAARDIMGGMGVVLDYGRQRAPQDVLASLDWLAQQGFVPIAEQGGPDAPFGDMILVFKRSSLAVRIIRDRGQWAVDVAAAGDGFIPLHIVLTAWQGGTPDPGRQIGAPLAEALAGVVSWLEPGNRTSEIAEAKAAWKEATRRYWENRRRQGSEAADGEAARKEAMRRVSRRRLP
jgi:hypothetical protein